MPTFTHGKNTRILANGYDVSGWLKTWNAKATADTADTSTIGSSAKSFIPGLKDGVFSVDGFADGTATGINTILVAMLGTSTVWTAVASTDAVGMATTTLGLPTGAATATIGALTAELGASGPTMRSSTKAVPVRTMSRRVAAE